MTDCAFRSLLRPFCTVLLQTTLVLAASAVEVHVAPDGDDVHDGSATAPVRNLERARELVRKRPPGEPALVRLHPGFHKRTTTFALGAEDSGTAAAPVVYRGEAADRTAVRLIGGIVVPAAACTPLTDAVVRTRLPQDLRGTVYTVDLAVLGIADVGVYGPRGFRRPYIPAPLEVFIDGQALSLARYPNEGEPHVPIAKVLDKGSVPRNGDFRDHGGVLVSNTDRLARWTRAQDIWLFGFFAVGYADDTVKIAALDPATRTITTAQATMYGYQSGRPWNAWQAINLLEELDRPGEYFADHATRRLYFIPPAGVDMARATVQVSVLNEPLIALEGASHVRLEHLTLECARGMGVYIERGASCRIQDCTLRNLGMVAVCIGQGTEPLAHFAHSGTAKPASRMLGSWHEHLYENTAFDRQGGSDHAVIGCRIHGIGTGGVSLGGGDRVHLVAADNRVEDCEITDFNRLGRSYAAGVNIDGVGNSVRRCFIHHAPGSGIYIHGNDQVVELNEIAWCIQHAEDMGAIYLGRDPSEQGIVIRHNLIHHTGDPHLKGGMPAIYFDDGACGVLVQGNIVAGNCGDAVLIHGGVDHRFEDNLFIDNKGLLHNATWSGAQWHKTFVTGELRSRLQGQVDILKPPYAARYPQLAATFKASPRRGVNTFRNNLMVRSQRPAGKDLALEGNLITDADPGFIDAAKGDYRLKADAEALRALPALGRLPFGGMGMTAGRDAGR